jgi:hypothetical protein
VSVCFPTPSSSDSTSSGTEGDGEDGDEQDDITNVDKQRYVQNCLDHLPCLPIWYITSAETSLTKPTIVFFRPKAS